MRISWRLLRPVAGWLVICLLVACAETVAARPQGIQSTDPGQLQSRTPDVGTPGPDANSAPAQTPSDSTGSAPSRTSDANQESSSPQSTPPQSPAVPQQPVGTAVAPYEKVTGVPASRPAGAAIAPAKQKRASSILIKVGLIVAAGVAIGTVVALSAATSSKPH